MTALALTFRRYSGTTVDLIGSNGQSPRTQRALLAPRWEHDCAVSRHPKHSQQRLQADCPIASSLSTAFSDTLQKTWTAGGTGGASHDTNGSSSKGVGHGSVFWPQKLLPAVIPDAKIFTFGYDADVDGFFTSASQNTIHQYAQNLLSDLADLRPSPEDVSLLAHQC